MAGPMLALPSASSSASPSPRTDPNLAVYGVVALAVAMLVAFGALLGAWLSLRSGTAVWPPAGATIQNYYGTTLTLTALLSAIAGGWGLYAVRRSARRQAIGGYGLQLFATLAFLNLLSYTVRVAHFGPGTHAYGAVFFAFMILMGAMEVISAVITIVALARLLGGQVTAATPAPAVAASLFSYFVFAGWCVVYAAVYVVK
jgi:heme/copper-type cytochrome/quinol oxidase subunit 3